MNVEGSQIVNPTLKDAHKASAEQRSQSSSNILKAGNQPRSVQVKVKMMEAKNRLRATNILPNARLRDMKKLSMSEMRKQQFGPEYCH